MRAELIGAVHPPGLGWPVVPDPSQEWWGAEALDDPASFQNFQRFGLERAEGVDEVAWAAMDADFMDRYRAVIRGDAAWDDPALLRRVRALALDPPLHHDRRWPTPGPPLDGALVAVTEDHVPDAADLARDRILGPWADERPARPLVTAAVEALAFTPLLRGGGSPAMTRYSKRPRPDEDARRGLKGAMQSPPMLWAVSDGPWRPLLPLAPRMSPDGPVVGALAALPGADAPVAAVARLHPTGLGTWAITAGIGLGATPPAAALQRRLTLELWRLRRHERRVTWEDLLRRRGEVLYRCCCLWWWRVQSAGALSTEETP